MAYDYTGPWSKVTGHQANIFPAGNNSTPFDTRTAVEYYISNGATPDKIVLGMPVYSRSFTQTIGLGQSFGGTGQGT
jgi:chitinase